MEPLAVVLAVLIPLGLALRTKASASAHEVQKPTIHRLGVNGNHFVLDSVQEPHPSLKKQSSE
jgi:hypothetical protein